MNMSIQHNLATMNTSGQFRITTDKRSKTTEKLSSGYRINQSADDAAGLAISEKMRRQIKGLNQASRNIQDGIGLLQVADGAMQEIADMLHREEELTVQAANGTNSDSDLQYIQQELEQLHSEIGRITDSTTFNEIPIFKGTVKKEIVSGNTAAKQSSPLSNIIGINNISGNKINSLLKIDVTDEFFIENWDKEEPIETGWHTTGEHIYLDNDGNRYTYQDFIDIANSFGPVNKLTYDKLTSSKYSVLVSFGYSSYLTTQTDRGIYDYVIMSGYYKHKIKRDDWYYRGDPDYGYADINGFNAIISDVGIYSGYYIGGKQSLSSWDYAKYFNYDPEGEGSSPTMFRDYGTGWIDFKDFNSTYAIEDLNGNGFSFKPDGSDAYCNIEFTTSDGEKTNKDGINYTFDGNTVSINISNITSGADIAKAIFSVMESESFFTNGHLQYIYSDDDPSKLYVVDNRTDKKNGGDSVFSDTIKEENKLSSSFEYEDAQDIWIQAGHNAGDGFYIVRPILDEKALKQHVINVIPRDTIPASITNVKKALGILNEKRSLCGAQQNKCEHAYNIVNNIAENTQYAESQIRDTDMAKTMVEHANLGILEQAGASMLSQANQSRQLLLSLLQ